MHPPRGNRTMGTRTPHQLLFIISVLLAGLGSQITTLADTITLKDGRTQQGEITRVENGSAMLKVGAGEIGIKLASIASVDKAPPKGFTEGMSAYSSGDAAKALGLLKPIATAFVGLPAEWARTAAGALADLYLTLEDYDNAAKAFEAFQSAYGEFGGGVRAEVGRARIAFAQGDFDAARQRIQPVIEEALGVFAPESSVASAYSQAFLLMGRLDEQAGDLQGALVNYLRTVTIYYQDPKAAADAAERAESLQKENTTLVVP